MEKVVRITRFIAFFILACAYIQSSRAAVVTDNPPPVMPMR